MVKIGRQKNRPNTLVSAASVRWRTLAEKVYSVTEQIRFKKSEHFTSTIEENKGNSNVMWKKLKNKNKNKKFMVDPNTN